jgi:hypothetical protein
MAEFIEIMDRMDGHPGPWLLVPSIQVEKVIRWEKRQRAVILGSDASADASKSQAAFRHCEEGEAKPSAQSLPLSVAKGGNLGWKT